MLQVSFIDSIDNIDATSWNAITGTDHPFTRYEFLQAMEHSGATTGHSGWQPHHLLVHRNNQLIALMPLFLKSHSYGEFVFDWSWADAYRQHGLAYYPKLLAAIPYTPATGPRLCIKPGEITESITEQVVSSLYREANTTGASSIHILFPEPHMKDHFRQQGLLPRLGVQFHWFNHGFNHFDDFLETFSSRKRKNLRKERQRVIEQGLQLEVLEGAEISPALWKTFYHFYQLTYAKRSGHGGYLELPFFQLVARSMPENLVLVMAKHEGEYVAGALNFRDSNKLYGRYWGCSKEFDYLHFETCYYQGIEYCIANKLQCFDPGAQGEHKIQRGFKPIRTWSNHWLAQEEFQQAVKHFLQRETPGMEQYLFESSELLPFRKN